MADLAFEACDLLRAIIGRLHSGSQLTLRGGPHSASLSLGEEGRHETQHRDAALCLIPLPAVVPDAKTFFGRIWLNRR